jgi:hypothetical protein
MKSFSSFLAFLLSFAFIAGLIWVTILGIKFVIAQYQMVDIQTTPILIIISILSIICSLIIAGAIKSSPMGNNRNINPEKAAVYNHFIDLLSISTEFEITPQNINMNAEYKLLRKEMVLWASDKVLKKYLEYDKYLNELTIDKKTLLNKGEKVIFEIRKDLGNRNQNLKTGQISSVLN